MGRRRTEPRSCPGREREKQRDKEGGPPGAMPNCSYCGCWRRAPGGLSPPSPPHMPQACPARSPGEGPPPGPLLSTQPPLTPGQLSTSGLCHPPSPTDTAVSPVPAPGPWAGTERPSLGCQQGMMSPAQGAGEGSWGMTSEHVQRAWHVPIAQQVQLILVWALRPRRRLLLLVVVLISQQEMVFKVTELLM